MSAKALRNKYNREFARMDRYGRSFAWFIVGCYLVQILLAVLAGAYLLSLPFGAGVVIGAIAINLFIGTRLRGLNNIIHECSHATFTREREDNWSIGKFCGVFLFSSFYDYRDEHLTHHKHLGDYDHDMDLQGIKGLSIHDPLSVRVVLRHLITPFLGRHLPYYLNLNLSARDGKAYSVAKAVLFATVLLLMVFFPLTVLFFVVTPFVVAYSSLNYWADCLDHAGIVDSPDDLESSRNLLAPHGLRELFFPRNDCFHLVHHLFPHVPARHLETSHKVLSHDDMYRARPNAVPMRELKTGSENGNVVPAE